MSGGKVGKLVEHLKKMPRPAYEYSTMSQSEWIQWYAKYKYWFEEYQKLLVGCAEDYPIRRKEIIEYEGGRIESIVVVTVEDKDEWFREWFAGLLRGDD